MVAYLVIHVIGFCKIFFYLRQWHRLNSLQRAVLESDTRQYFYVDAHIRFCTFCYTPAILYENFDLLVSYVILYGVLCCVNYWFCQQKISKWINVFILK